MALPPDNPKKSAADERFAAQQDGFLREVDEALREDQMASALKRFGLPVAAAIVVGLLGLGGYLYWDHAAKRKAADSSEKTILALEKFTGGSADGAITDLSALAKDGSDGSKTAAALLIAGMKQQQGKMDEAAKAFAAVAADAAAPQPYRDLATVREMAIRFDAANPQQVIDRLKPLAVPGNAWFGSAGEMVGLAYLKQGRPDLAGPLFAAVGKDKGVPETLRARARLVAGQLGFDPGEAPTVAEQGADDAAAPAAPAAPAAQ